MSLGRSAKYSLYRFGGVLPLAGQQEVKGAAGPLARRRSILRHPSCEANHLSEAV